MLKPYYSKGKITIYHGKAEEILRAMPKREIGTVLLDPPYTLSIDSARAVAERISTIILLGLDRYTVIPGPGEWVRCESLTPRAESGHPVARPVEVICDLLKLSESDPIIDPYMGIGSTLRAAKMLGREAIGIELELKWCETAVRELELI